METVNAVPAHPKVEDSLKKRYFYKLGTNLFGFMLSFVTAGIAPRALGPAAYGDFSFLSNFFSQIVSFLDTGTSLGFYTKLSQRLREPGLIRFYWGFVGIVSMSLFVLVAGGFTLGLQNSVWPEQQALYIWMAAVFALLAWVNQIIGKVVDAYGLTAGGEIARLQQRVLGVSLILLMFWLSHFSLEEYFLYHYLILLFLCLGWWRVLKKNGVALFPKARLTALMTRSYVREFYEYSAPLITYALVGLLVGMLDRWLLQRFAGSAEQGFYGLSYKIGAIVFLFTSAITPLLTREFSKAFGDQDLARMRTLFRRYIPMLYFVAAFLGVFVAIQADKVTKIFGGSEFREATLPIAIMAFYPLHQTYGQLSGSVFYATGRTRLYRNLGISVLFLGSFISFWLIAPENWLGLNLGAVGLALKMVVVQFVSVNLQLWFNARLLQLSFRRFLWHQLYSVALLAAVAGLVMVGVDQVVKNTVLAFLISGFIYTLGCAGVGFLFPSIFSISRAELMNQLTQLRLKVTGNRKESQD